MGIPLSFFLATLWHVEVPGQGGQGGQGSYPSCACDLCCSCGNVRPLTHSVLPLGIEPAFWRCRDAEPIVPQREILAWLLLSFFFFFCFLGLHPWHMEVSRLGVELEVQQPTYTTVTAMPDPQPAERGQGSNQHPQGS